MRNLEFIGKKERENKGKGEEIVVPVYPSTEGLTQKNIQEAIRFAFDRCISQVIDPLPTEFLQKFDLDQLKVCLKKLHFPQNNEEWERAYNRFLFEELVVFQGALLYGKEKLREASGYSHNFSKDDISSFIKSLPFTLTDDQKKVISEVLEDMKSSKPMNRLIQGDVGSGKTIVAIIALLASALSGGQGVFLVPTEILAKQHYNNITRLLSDKFNIEVILLTASTKNKAKVYDQIHQKIGQIIIGTHALLEEKLKFNNLTLIVTDEQHRFGVKQRGTLKSKGKYPDVLVMSATPIPRTLTQVLYGDLDISIIKQLPKGRKEVKTYCVSPDVRKKVYQFVDKEIKKGRQCYIICPLVEDSDKVVGESVLNYFKKVEKIFRHPLGLIHGKMKESEKDEVMEKFKNGFYSILVATTVVEVGVDIPNATLIVIENAERFGLAQLHQLRGRVGRGNNQSYCILVNHSTTDLAKKRMEIMVKTTDGFTISEQDLILRGPGEFFGVRQHGLPEFKYFNILRDIEQVPKGKEGAIFLLNNIYKEEYKDIYGKIKAFYSNYIN